MVFRNDCFLSGYRKLINMKNTGHDGNLLSYEIISSYRLV